jgi:hypothetical protein
MNRELGVMNYELSHFSRHLENLSLNLSPKRRETLNCTPLPNAGRGQGG